ncbi:serine hydrolase domain-containing protein [Paenimyroides aestuarii]|uniref:Beta-lactamase family protein n=1 Tax=Paenimyroides aestuarii TaxID=2968490 RepID=A0ABY5NQ25_9FLAO|nr:serine hydrolase domain-containing protein [Paenimyroides aestuarii]UUV20593.1 beta-lactamase family protein [Paenimyroides aestuarii]
MTKKAIILLSFLITTNCFSQTDSNKIAVNNFLNYLSKENSFLGTVEMKKGNETVYSYKSNPLKAENGQYRVGSVTKIFTAIAVFQLIEEKKLTLQTPLSKFYPQIKYADQITIENLLSHTSGIFNITFWDNYYSTRNQNFSKEQILNIITKEKPDFKPNKDCSYSNSNYVLLGYIIEDLTGKSYATNIDERIVKKAGLQKTFVAENEQDIKQYKSYLFNGKDWFEDVSSHPSLPFAAGAIISNVSDLNKLMYHLFHGDLVSNESLAVMQKLKSKAIGHGLFKAPFYDKIGWGHTGGIDEFKSAALYFPSEDLYLSITCNGSRLNINDIMVGILSAYFDKKYEYPVFYHSEVTKPELAIFTGTYKAKIAGLVTIAKFEITEAENNYLFMNELENGKIGERALLERMDANTFFLRNAKGKLIFTMENNKVKNLVLEQGKMAIKCVKVK